MDDQGDDQGAAQGEAENAQAPPPKRESKQKKQAKGIPAKLSDDVIEEMQGLFGDVDDEGKRLTSEAIAEQLGITRSTVDRYRRKWDQAKHSEETLRNDAAVPDPAAQFEALLRETPGLERAKVEYAINIVKRNPAMLQNPGELESLLQQWVGLKPVLVRNIISAVMNSQMQQQGGGQSRYYGMPPFGQPGSPYWMTPQWGVLPGQMAGFPPQGMPPWMQPPPPAQLTKSDIAELVEKQITKALDRLQPREPPTPEAEYEEVQEPVMRDGKPLRDANGEVVVRFVRRPIKANQDPIDQLIRFKQAGLLGGQDDPTKALADQIRRLEERLQERRAPEEGEANRKVLDEMANIKERLAAEQARREVEEKYRGQFDDLRADQHQRELRVLESRSNLDANGQVLLRGVDTLEKTTGKFMDNQDKRMGRLEQLALQMLRPAQGGTTVPIPEDDLAALAQRQDLIDAQEGVPPPPVARPAPAPTKPAPPPPRPTPPAKPPPPPTDDDDPLQHAETVTTINHEAEGA